MEVVSLNNQREHQIPFTRTNILQRDLFCYSSILSVLYFAHMTKHRWIKEKGKGNGTIEDVKVMEVELEEREDGRMEKVVKYGCRNP